MHLGRTIILLSIVRHSIFVVDWTWAGVGEEWAASCIPKCLAPKSMLLQEIVVAASRGDFVAENCLRTRIISPDMALHFFGTRRMIVVVAW